MPLAVTLGLDLASSSAMERMRHMLTEQDFGYEPHITLAVWPDDRSASTVLEVVAQLASAWRALPVTLCGVGLFPRPSSILWAAPVVTEDLLRRHRALHDALPALTSHPHYRVGAWMPHVTLAGPLDDPGRAVAALAPSWQPVTGVLDRVEVLRFAPIAVLCSHPLRDR